MKKIKILRIINRFNIAGPSYNVTFLTRFMGDEYETKLVGGLPDAGESDSLHILEKYGVSPILIEERQVSNGWRKRSYHTSLGVFRSYRSKSLVRFSPNWSFFKYFCSCNGEFNST
ncbi:MAG: hypothetical protein P8H43_02140 [Crocinitomicaceae bacterium]|nr:hypothetical protein [Crocinitomicaceae bacterium]